MSPGGAATAPGTAGAAAVSAAGASSPVLGAASDGFAGSGFAGTGFAAALGFLVILGATAAEATQAVGALLLLGLVAAPAAAAQRLARNPYRSLALAAVLAVAAVWGGLAFAYVVPRVPPSTAIIVLAASFYLAAAGMDSRPHGEPVGRAREA